MSNPPSFEDVIWHLRNNAEASVRAQAARMLGDHVEALDDDQYEAAKAALNQALTDPDPSVLMAAMTALTGYHRIGMQEMVHLEDDDNGETEIVVAAHCSVCGKPEALVSPDECELANCPYK